MTRRVGADHVLGQGRGICGYMGARARHDATCGDKGRACEGAMTGHVWGQDRGTFGARARHLKGKVRAPLPPPP